MPEAQIKSKNKKIIDATAGLSNQMKKELMLMNSFLKEPILDTKETKIVDKVNLKSGKN